MKKGHAKTKSIDSRAGDAILGVIAVIAVGIQFLRFVQISPKLAAVSAATASDSPPPLAHDPALAFAAADIDDYQQLMQHTQQVVETIKSLPTTRPVQYQGLKVNPFKLSRGPSIVVDHVEQERVDTFAAAQEMTLQSIMHSDLAHVCLINNVLIRENQQLNGFTIDQINSDSVIIHRGKYRFELRLIK